MTKPVIERCPFCSSDEFKTRTVRDGRLVRVVLSNPRLMPGHELVLPKRYVERLSELSTEERTELFDLAILTQEAVINKFATGCDLRQHYRPFTGAKTKFNTWRNIRQIPSSSSESDAMSRDLKQRGFSFVGTTICYAFMQAAGMINDHTTDCFRFSKKVLNPK